jgi:anti-sigma factor RsiW
MTHPKNLIAWLDNELPPNESEEVGAHIEQCAECRAEIRLFAEVTETLVQMGGKGGRWWRRALVPIPIAAAAALLMLVHQPPPAPPSPSGEVPLLRVAIPVEAVLPPGILPPGSHIVADIGADGRATAFNLLP